jgi:cytochrome c peroxidase
MKTGFFPALLAVALAGCSGDDGYADIPVPIERPSNFPEIAYDLSANPPTQKGVALGRKLFYDGRLSSDGVVSCAFCHIQSHAFTHHGHTVSHGVNNAQGIRNAQPIQNMAYQRTFMWDGAADHLDLQPIIPLTSPVEMDGNLAAILEMMQADTQYRKLFGQAFADGEVSIENMLKALAQFMLTATSSHSRFDKFRRGEPDGSLDPEELSGYAVFQTKCATCHATDLFTDGSFRNNGIAVNPLVDDRGRYNVTLLPEDLYKFKVPSLRNIEKTAPYMHDGRFGTLEAVLDHYTSGIAASPSLDQALQDGIALTTLEKQQIIAFLKTLTDDQFLNDPKLSEF